MDRKIPTSHGTTQFSHTSQQAVNFWLFPGRLYEAVMKIMIFLVFVEFLAWIFGHVDKSLGGFERRTVQSLVFLHLLHQFVSTKLVHPSVNIQKYKICWLECEYYCLLGRISSVFFMAKRMCLPERTTGEWWETKSEDSPNVALQRTEQDVLLQW